MAFGNVLTQFGLQVTWMKRTITGRDAYGIDIYSTSIPQVLNNVPVWPAGSSELMQGQDVLTDLLVAVVPHGLGVSPTDQMIVFGRTYEVTGSPFDWVSPLTGTRVGVQINLKVVTG
jgi:hypothetical protein